MQGIRQRPGRLVLTGLALLLASLMVFASILAQRVVSQTFLESFGTIPASASVVVQPGEGGNLTAAQFTKVKAIPGVAFAAAQQYGSLILTDHGARELDISADPGTGPLSEQTVIAGRYPTGPRQIAVTRETARVLALKPGAHLRIPLSGGNSRQLGKTSTVTVTAVVDGDQSYRAYTTNATLTGLLGNASFDRIDVKVTPAAASEQVIASITRSLAGGEGPILIQKASGARVDEARQQVRQFDLLFALIEAFVLVAVAASSMVATSTFRIVFGQRLRQLALLRTLGGQQRQISVALGVEGLLTGLTAGLLGVLGAFVLVMITTVVAGVIGHPLARGPFPVVLAMATVAGTGLVSSVAALAPALAAAGVSPLRALRSAQTVQAHAGLGLLRLSCAGVTGGLALLLAGVGYHHLPGPESDYSSVLANLLLIIVSATFLFLTMIALGPLLVRAVLAVLAPALTRSGVTGEMAVQSLRSSSRRAAAVIMVISLGASLIAGVVAASASLRTYVNSGLAISAPADYLLTSDKALPARTLRQLTNNATVDHVTPYRSVQLGIGTSSTSSYQAVDLDLSALPALESVTPSSGSISGRIQNGVVLSNQVATRLAVTAGDQIRLTNGNEHLMVPVRAVLAGRVPADSDVVVAAADLDRLGFGPSVNGIFMDTAHQGSAAPAAAEQSVRRILGPTQNQDLMALSDDNAANQSAIAKIFVAALALVGLTIVIAVVGVGTTMSLTVMERSREFGVMRALGLTRQGVRLLVTAEASLYGFVGAAMGLLIGLPYAWIAVRSMNLRTPVQFPVLQLLTLILVLTGVTLVTGLLPARRAVRSSPMAALGSDT